MCAAFAKANPIFVPSNNKTYIMKLLFTSIVLLLTSFAFAQDTHTLTVSVENIKSEDGVIMISLSTEDQFMKAAPTQSAELNIQNGKATTTFENVSSGAYAIMVLHDKNKNGVMDFSPQGMPEEDYGMSNNPMSYGPPRWEDAKFELSQDQQITIRL